MSTIRDSNVEYESETLPRLQRLSDDSVRIRAAAKLNLSLAVGATRPDGYHRFESLMTSVSLCDELTISNAVAGISITCDDPLVPTDCDNLVYRAASLLAWYARVSPAIHIDIQKRIPSQAGLGGGSSDAAATLLALNELWNVDLPISALGEIGALLGSDVNFFLEGPFAVCRGRGEQVDPVDGEFDFWAAIMQGAGRLATHEVYKYHRLSDPNCFGLADELIELLATEDASEIRSRFRNDLESPAFRVDKHLEMLRTDLEKAGRVPVRLSGSGTAMFTTFETREQAVHYLQRISDIYPDLSTWLVRNNPW